MPGDGLPEKRQAFRKDRIPDRAVLLLDRQAVQEDSKEFRPVGLVDGAGNVVHRGPEAGIEGRATRAEPGPAPAYIRGYGLRTVRHDLHVGTVLGFDRIQ